MPSSLVSFAAARDSGPSGARAVAKETTPSPDQVCFTFVSLKSLPYEGLAQAKCEARFILSKRTVTTSLVGWFRPKYSFVRT